MSRVRGAAARAVSGGSPVLLRHPGPVQRDGAHAPPAARQLPRGAPWPEPRAGLAAKSRA